MVRDKKGEGHAVLTVKTDKGEYILDNQNENVVAWTETGYRLSSASRKATRTSGSCSVTTVRRYRPRARRTANDNRNFGTRDPVTSPPLPVPDRFARGQPSPQRLAATFCSQLFEHDLPGKPAPISGTLHLGV